MFKIIRHFERFESKTIFEKYLSSMVPDKKIEQCFRVLNIPVNSKQDEVRAAFLELAKKYHPDSGTPEANIEKFCEIENAFRVLTHHNTGNTEEIEQLQFDIKHTAPQHRQYLSYGGVGHGSPMQREKQWTQTRARKAAQNVMEHKISKAIASENTIMKMEDLTKKQYIKTNYGFDRLVEDLIQEAMSKGEFDNLSGHGKPLKGQNYNPYVDFTTHKINEVLINNGFTPEWITLNKDLKQEIANMKEELQSERARLGPVPITDAESLKWKAICQRYSEFANKINAKITTFNLIVPLMNKQMFLINFDKMSDEILQHGHFNSKLEAFHDSPASKKPLNDDKLILVLKTFSDFLSTIISLLRNTKNSKGTS